VRLFSRRTFVRYEESPVIICPKCTKENQDHYKFCLGCGAELPRDASPKKFAPASNTPPHGVPAVQAPPPAQQQQQAAAARILDEATSQGQGPAGSSDAPPVICPQCSHPNPSSNKFCASCGFKLSKLASVPAPAAPAAAPAPQPQAPAPAAPPLPTGGPLPASSVVLDTPVAGGVTLTALRADGTEAGAFYIPAAPTTLGRDSGSIFAGDSYLSPRHATLTPKGKQVIVRDESSLNGIYRKIGRDEPVELGFNDIFRIGQEILRVEQLIPLAKSADGVERLGSPARGYVARIALLIGRDTTGNAYPIPETGLHLGRERGDVLFPEDGYVSGLHCRLSFANGKIYLTDLGSSNGSFVRLMKDTAISSGEILLMGQQLFRITVNA
jgi:pSer/pThr/pTyr-binding forkhead associated (FHA) protein